VAQIRILDSTYRCMQRLGYLKRLVRRVVAVNTSSLENLGSDLTRTVMRKEKVPLTADRVAYIRQRLFDRVYNGLKKQAAAWGESETGDESMVAMELQDLYLADPLLPSQTGKLVRNGARKYPPLGVNLGFIRAGTYSPNTRALSLLHFTPEAELQAFLDYHPDANPLRVSRAQALLLLYSLLENDGEVVCPLFSQLAEDANEGFSDRDAGDRLPEIYRALIRRHRRRLLSADERERIESLSQTASSIERWRERSYTGGGAHIEAGSPRVEPYVDIGLLQKPDPFRYLYTFTSAGLTWSEALAEVESDAQIADFLATRFFATAARAADISAESLDDPEAIAHRLYRAWQIVQSTGGYAPIVEMALVAGILALLEEGLVIEPAVAREAIIAYQKANPYQIRFTVNRMGDLAHARFLEEPTSE
jgi:hypothetical protein